MTWVSRSMIYPGLSTDSFFTNGARPPQVNRNYGRSFNGDAAGHGGQSDGSVTGGSWLQGFPVPALTVDVDDWDYFEDTARSVTVTTGGIGVSGVARTNAALSGIGLAGAAINYGHAGKNVWGAYIDGVRAEDGVGVTHGAEINVANLVGPSPRGGATPYDTFVDGMTVGVAVPGGSDAAVFGRSYWNDVGIELRDNGAPFVTGINFRFDAIVRKGKSDDKTSVGNAGYARAIAMASEQGISWYSQAATVVAATAITSGETYIIQTVGTTDFTLIGAASNNVGVSFVATGAGTGTGTASIAGSQAEVVRMYSEVVSSDRRWEMVFTNDAFRVTEGVSPDFNLFAVNYSANADSGVLITPGTSGVDPVIEPTAATAGKNIHLRGRSGAGVKIDVPEYANNAAAAAALDVGVLYYRTGHGLDIVR